MTTRTTIDKILEAITKRELAFPHWPAFHAYYQSLVASVITSFVAHASELSNAKLRLLAIALADSDFISSGRLRSDLIDNAVSNFERHIEAIPLADLRTMVAHHHCVYNKLPGPVPPHPTMGAIPIIPRRVLPRTYAGVGKGDAPVVRFDQRVCPNGDACVLGGRRCELMHVYF